MAKSRDPFDRMLIARVIVDECTLISRDRAFGSHDGLSLLVA